VRIWGNLTFVSATTLLSLAGHILEVALWAFVFDLCGGVADFMVALYCSAGNYTTVGSGDVVLSPRWKLLGPIEAAVGLLIFAVIQGLFHARFDGGDHNSSKSLLRRAGASVSEEIATVRPYAYIAQGNESAIAETNGLRLMQGLKDCVVFAGISQKRTHS
jgi:Ion channel